MSADHGYQLPQWGERISYAAARAARRARPVLVSSSVPIAAPEDLLTLLAQSQRADEMSFFSECPAQGIAIAGVGSAWTASSAGPQRFREIAAACDRVVADAVIDNQGGPASWGPLFVGGFAFAPDCELPGAWRGFPAGRLLVPRLLIVRRGREARLTLSTAVAPGCEPDDVCRRAVRDLPQLEGALLEEGPAEKPGRRYEAVATTPPEQWMRRVAETVADIRAGRLEKLVLARTCTVNSDSQFNCLGVVRRLRQHYPSCTTFWVRTPDGDFLGATPEPLVNLSGGSVRTTAIAGSIGRGASPAADRALGRALLQSGKEQIEHAIVVDAITQALAPVCESLEVAAQPELMRLENAQHLATPIAGRLARTEHVLDLVSRLHPSPAVGGSPRDLALSVISQREGFARGWYAGPLGWMDARGDGEFGVAIRSAFIRGCQASLFAGAGIVADSDPQQELAETRLKLQPLLSALMEL